MAFRLPVVAETDECGLHLIIHAIPWGVAKKASRAGESEEALTDFLRAVWETCVDVRTDESGESAEKPDVEEMPVEVLNRIVELASRRDGEGGVNFPHG